MTLSVESIIAIIGTLTGGTGILAYLGAKKERKAQAELAGASALIEMQKSYAQYVIDNNKVINDLKNEIKDISTQLHNYKNQCKQCSNNKL
jgi:hypothetical protein